MKAFNKIITKQELMGELQRHYALDNFMQGENFEGGKGCAVGCSLESASRLKGIEVSYSDHGAYPEILGLPEWFARVQDSIFEGLSVEDSKEWPLRSMGAIKEGADLNIIKNEFLARVIEATFDDYDSEQFPDVRAAQVMVVEGLRENDLDKLTKGRSAAYAAAYAAADAAYAAYAAAYADAAYAAADAAYAAYAAAYAYAAYAAAAYAYAADAYAAAAYTAAAVDASKSSYKLISDILVELLESMEVAQ